MRIGYGYDVHTFSKDRKLILGGVAIPHVKGLLGHSDADVLVHAIIDAIIGAVAEGDIGAHFPCNDPQYKDISSLILLNETKKLLVKNGYAINNIDATVVLEKPTLAPFIEEMRLNIAKTLDISTKQVNVKAKTEEGLGFTGKKQGIKAYAVCLIHQAVN